MKKMKFAFVLMSAVALLGTSNAWAQTWGIDEKEEEPLFPEFPDDYCGPSCSFSLSEDGKTLIIKGSDDPDNPAQVKGLPDSLGECIPFRLGIDVTGITDIKFEGYINEISNPYSGPFDYFEALENVDFGDTASNLIIGNEAFKKCTSLKGVVIPHNSIIGEFAFINCPSLTEIVIPPETILNDHAFYRTGLQEGSVFCIKSDIESGRCSSSKFDGIEPWPYEITEDGTYYYNPEGQLVRAIDKDGHEIDISKSSSSEETHSSEPTHVARRIYTVEEATEAVSGKGKNTFSIRYR